jgi:mycothiol synthase
VRPPPGYASRAASRDDLGAIDALFAAYDLATLGFAESSVEQLEEDFRTPGFEPARDTWYVTAGPAGPLAAFALYKDGEPGQEGSQGFGRVHPEHSARGLGAFLVDNVDARWRSSTARAGLIRNWLTPADAMAAALFASRGYEVVRREFHLERPLRDLKPVQVPVGIRIRPLRAGEERALHAVNEEAFAHHWGFRPSTFEDWSAVLGLSSAAPGLTWVAADGDEMVGELVLLVQQDVGWIEILGVRPRWRGRGIGRALLRTGFAELARRDFGTVRLSVDAGNETGALRLYESEGMTVRREWHVVEKRLD